MKIRLLFTLSFLMIIGCNYNRMKETGAASGPRVSGRDLGPLDFKTVTQMVLGPQCLRCHSNADRQGGFSAQDYAEVKEKIRRVAFRSLEKRDMPSQGLPASEATILRAWIEQGAPEMIVGGPAKPGPDLSAGPNDFKKIQKVFSGESRCLSCHNSESPEAGLDLTSIAQVRKKIDRIFVRALVTQDMPLRPFPVLKPQERDILWKWIDAGMPE